MSDPKISNPATIEIADVIPGEVTKLELAPSSRSLIPAFLLTPLIFPFFLGIWWYFSQIRASGYLVTNERIYLRRIFFRKNTSTIQLVEINDVTCHQGVWGRIFDYGNVLVTPFSGRSYGLQAIRSPHSVQNTLIVLARNAQNRSQKTVTMRPMNR